MQFISERDKKIMWHPFTQEKTSPPVIAIKNSRGAYVYDEQGNSYLDLISSWWVNLHGHCHPEIALSIYEQALRLEHVIFAGFTHEPAVTLCENLKILLPQNLTRFFFSDNGSTAVEVALKMSYQYWCNQHQKERTLFLSFKGGYHGDTFGSMSVSKSCGFHDNFSKFFFKVLTIPYPATWDDDTEVLSKEEYALMILDQHLSKYGNQIISIILEPLIQGACGMRICRPIFVKEVVKRVRKYGILIILDEVMTAFGRIGTNFAFEQIDIIPDFICLAKGITGGFLPLALTITTEKIYNIFMHNEKKYSFAHGHSYTANPLACAAAITSLNLLMREETQQAIHKINKCHIEGILYLKNLALNISNTRVLGTISAFEIDKKININQLKLEFLEQGLLLRPLGNIVYLLPPYCVSSLELQNSYEKIGAILKKHLNFNIS